MVQWDKIVYLLFAAFLVAVMTYIVMFYRGMGFWTMRHEVTVKLILVFSFPFTKNVLVP
jgi:hypothetical protein